MEPEVPKNTIAGDRLVLALANTSTLFCVSKASLAAEDILLV
jgi:hypothetical protein